MQASLGFIETIGMTAAIIAADQMVKQTYVEIVSFEKSGAGYVSVFVRGQLDSVKIALEIGASEAQNLGELISVHLISKPDEGIQCLLPQTGLEGQDANL